MKKILFFLLFFMHYLNGYGITIDFETAFHAYQNNNWKESYLIFFQLFEKEKKPIYCFYLGNISLYLNREEEAIEWYKKGLNSPIIPSDAYFFNLSALLIKKNRPQEAIFYLEKMENKNATIRFILSSLYYNQKQYSKAEEQIKAILSENKLPDEFLLGIYENYFFISLVQNKSYQALSIAQALKNFSDVSFDFWYAYAGLLAENSQLTKALEIYNKLLDSEKSKREWLYQKILALLIFQKKDYQEALKHTQQAVKIYGGVKNFLLYQAYAFYMTENYAEAWATIENFIPSEKEEYKMKASLAYKAGKEQEAQKILERAFLLYPEEDILTNLLSLYVKKENYKQAELVIQFFHEKYKTEKFMHWLFQFAILQQDYKKAIEYGEKIIASDWPKPYYFYYNLGKSYEKNLNIPKAIQYYEIAKKEMPDFVYPYIALAGILTNQGQYQTAIDHYLIAIKLVPDYAIYYYQLAQVYALSKNYFLSKEFIKQALYKQLPKHFIENDPLFDPVLKEFPELAKEIENS